jgi:Monooxygenase af470-like
MLSELSQQKELGFLNGDMLLNWRGVTMVQYWKSFEQLAAYAHSRDASHLPAWAAFNRAIVSDGSVGIRYETYSVEPHHSETVYANMPR